MAVAILPVCCEIQSFLNKLSHVGSQTLQFKTAKGVQQSLWHASDLKVEFIPTETADQIISFTRPQLHVQQQLIPIQKNVS